MTPRFTSRQLACALCVSAATLSGLATSSALAQDTSGASDVEMIVPFGTGGGADKLARESAKLLVGLLPASVKVTNIPGATGNTGIAKLLSAPSDGNTKAVLTADTFALLAYLNPGWKMSDITPLAIMMKQPSALFLPTNSRFKNWSDFEKEARLRPDTLRIAITGLGSPDYLTLQQLAAAGIKLAPLPLSKPEERYRAVLEGKADALYEQQGDIQELIDSKQLRPVIVFNGARVASLKDVPTSQELGLGNARNQFRAIVVKAGTDPAKIKTMSDAFEKLAALTQYKTYLNNEAAMKDSYIPEKNAAEFLNSELDAMKRIVQSLPFHARYIINESEFERYVEPF